MPFQGGAVNTYYLVLRAIPSPENPYFNEVEGAFVSCWVCNDDPVSAVTIASFKARQLTWEIVRLEEPPINVTEEDYLKKEMRWKVTGPLKFREFPLPLQLGQRTGKRPLGQ